MTRPSAFLVVLVIVVAGAVIPAPRSVQQSHDPFPAGWDAAGRIGAPDGPEASLRATNGAPLPVPVTSSVTGEPIPALRVTGNATWYCSATSACTHGYSPSDLVAAIDTNTGIHQGDVLRVTSGRNHVDVLVVDTCLCKGRRIIDLTSGAFRHLAPLSAGVIAVSITVVGGIDEPVTATAPNPTGPATDVVP